MVIYPAGWWYEEVNQDKIDRILNALEDGLPAEEFLASE
jgi:(2Fe-2S) ferredoxin